MTTQARRRMTLAHYVKARNGVPLGARRSMRNMLNRCFTAANQAAFWRHWNPIFSYGLGRWVYQPLQPWLGRLPALWLTFIANGILHDVVMSIASGRVRSVFTPWFLLIGLWVTVEQYFAWQWPMSRFRPLWHLLALSSSLFLSQPFWR